MAEPVVNLELQPCSDERIRTASWDQLISGEQSRADQTGAGLEYPGLRLRICLLERNVPAEPRPTSTHCWFLQIVVGSVRAASTEPSRVGQFSSNRSDAGIEQVLLAEPRSEPH